MIACDILHPRHVPVGPGPENTRSGASADTPGCTASTLAVTLIMYTSIRYTDRLIEAGEQGAVGTNRRILPITSGGCPYCY
jgi:hypothetical protein